MHKGCRKTKNDFVRKEIIIFVCTNKSNGSMDDLFKANVEALSRSEVGGFGEICAQSPKPGKFRMNCAQSPKPGKFRMKYCSTCSAHDYYTRDYIAFCPN